MAQRPCDALCGAARNGCCPYAGRLQHLPQQDTTDRRRAKKCDRNAYLSVLDDATLTRFDDRARIEMGRHLISAWTMADRPAPG